jgi:hypothetical protein
MRKQHIFLYVRRFPQKTEGSTARRLPMCFEKKKMIKRLYKTEHNETQQNQKMSQSPSKNDLFKSHDVPTARGLLWFRENQPSIKDAKAS